MQTQGILAILVIFIAAGAASSQGVYPGDEAVFSRCPTVERLARSGQLGQMADPVFEDREAAQSFAQECADAARELGSVLGLSKNYVDLRTQAALAAEFLTGDAYLLETSQVKSVVKLREWVRIPPPSGFVYVKKYESAASMPPEVAAAFRGTIGSEGAQIRGVTIQGRYIALLETKYHDELVDNLAHELVHAYITLASPAPLPMWFQEGAAVYFSTGKESRLYGRTGDPKVTQVTIPEEYKRKLHSFQYIESRVGREKLFEFVRKSVQTGRVDPRSALGLGPVKKPARRPIWLAALVVAGIAVALFAIWIVSRRGEGWVD